MFNAYENAEGRVIYATDTAYNAIYKQQGFRPQSATENIFTATLGSSYTLRSNSDDCYFSIGTAKPKRVTKSAKA